MKSKKKLIALAAVLGITGIGGTLAYFTQELVRVNIFDTGHYDSELVEDFHPSDGENWEPGAFVNKDVTVKNTGDVPILARVKFQEKWVRKGTGEVIYDVDTARDKDMPMLGTPSDAVPNNKFENVWQGDPGDGKTGTDQDDSVVYKQLLLGDDWVYNPSDGYYYYRHLLMPEGEGTSETSKLLDGVVLAENIDMGKYKEAKFYTLTEGEPDDGDWIEFATDSNAQYLSTAQMRDKLKEEGKFITHMKAVTDYEAAGLEGYSKADYTLTVTAQTVQATKQAVETVFDKVDFVSLGCDWNLIDETVEGNRNQETAAETTAAEMGAAGTTAGQAAE